MSTGPIPPVPSQPDDQRRLGLPAVAGIAVAVLVIAGVVGYLIGHSGGDDSGKTSGYRDGLAAGRAQVQANFARGAPGYRAIFTAGQVDGQAQGQRNGEAAGQRSGEAAGQKVGFDQGRQVGIKSGQQQGVQEGAAAALGGFDDWTSGDFYIVTTAAGSKSSGLSTIVATRKTIEPDTNYRLCQSTDAGGASTSELCQSPVVQPTPPAGGGGSGGGGTATTTTATTATATTPGG